MCSDSARPRAVRFQDVTDRVEHELPAWLSVGENGFGLEPTMTPLHSPELPRLPRPALAPRLESLRPAASQRPSRPPAAPSQPFGVRPSLHGALFEPGGSVPPPASPSQPPGGEGFDAGAGGGVRERRRDTLIEDLVPRAEEEAVLAIRGALEAFTAARQAQLASAERELIQLVRVICRRVVLREVSLSHATIEALVREGLGALGGSDKVNVRLGTFFADALDHIQDNLQHQGIACNVMVDGSLPAHGCVVETELGRVDESVEARLAVLLENLDVAG